MTKLNLTIKLTQNFQTVEIGATDIDIQKYYDTEQWLIKSGKEILTQIAGDEEKPVITTQTNYQPATQTKGALCSQKQVNFLRSLGYQGPVDDMSVTEANNLIKELKNKKDN